MATSEGLTWNEFWHWFDQQPVVTQLDILQTNDLIRTLQQMSPSTQAEALEMAPAFVQAAVNVNEHRARVRQAVQDILRSIQ